MTTICLECGASLMSEIEVCPCKRPYRRRRVPTTDGLAALKAIMQHRSATMEGIVAWRAIWYRRDYDPALDPDDTYLVGLILDGA